MAVSTHKFHNLLNRNDARAFSLQTVNYGDYIYPNPFLDGIYGKTIINVYGYDDPNQYVNDSSETGYLTSENRVELYNRVGIITREFDIVVNADEGLIQGDSNNFVKHLSKGYYQPLHEWDIRTDGGTSSEIVFNLSGGDYRSFAFDSNFTVKDSAYFANDSAWSKLSEYEPLITRHQYDKNNATFIYVHDGIVIKEDTIIPLIIDSGVLYENTQPAPPGYYTQAELDSAAASGGGGGGVADPEAWS